MEKTNEEQLKNRIKELEEKLAKKFNLPERILEIKKAP